MDRPTDTRAGNLELAIDMMEEGFELKRSSLRRRFPALSDKEIEQKLEEWIASRPPDASGRATPWPRVH